MKDRAKCQNRTKYEDENTTENIEKIPDNKLLQSLLRVEFSGLYFLENDKEDMKKYGDCPGEGEVVCFRFQLRHNRGATIEQSKWAFCQKWKFSSEDLKV